MWVHLLTAFQVSQGFTVTFHLASGPIEVAVSAFTGEPRYIRGETIPDRNAITIRADAVLAYSIEES